MPGEIAGLPNPLALMPSARKSHLHSNVVNIASYQEFREARGRIRRKESDRSWRVLRLGGTHFSRAANVEEALDILRCLERQQRRRIEGLGLTYLLDAPHIASFYRKLVTDGLDSGYVVVTALRAGDEVVGALLGIWSGPRFTILRIGNAGEAWKTCSPGRLVITRTMEELAKRAAPPSTSRQAITSSSAASGRSAGTSSSSRSPPPWLGVPMVARAAVKRRMLRYPKLTSRLRRLVQRGAGPAGADDGAPVRRRTEASSP